MSASGQVTINGTLLGGPTVSGDGVFPSGITNLPFSALPATKAYAATTGAQSAAVASPSAFVSLGGIDNTIGTVRLANTLYLRTNAALDVRLTQRADVGTTTLVLTGVKGLLVLEVDDTRAIEKVEVQGTGTIEWFACGNS